MILSVAAAAGTVVDVAVFIDIAAIVVATAALQMLLLLQQVLLFVLPTVN